MSTISNSKPKNKNKTKRDEDSSSYEEASNPGPSGQQERDNSGAKPRIVSKEVLLNSKVAIKTRAGPKSSKFGNIKPTASSPPPLEALGSMTEESISACQETGMQKSYEMETATDVANLSDLSDVSVASVRTTASGATKRKKRTISSKSKRRRDRERNRTGSSTEMEEDEDDNPLKERRGRKITTGKGVEVRARRTARNELKSLQQQKLDMEIVLKGGYDPSDYRGENRAKRQGELEEELQNLPVRDIAAQLAEVAKKVEMVANKSSNLKGGYVKELKEAALKISIGTDALVCRSIPKDNGNARETERLREEVRDLREEIKRLQTQRDQVLMPPPAQLEGGLGEHSHEDRMDIDEKGGNLLRELLTSPRRNSQLLDRRYKENPKSSVMKTKTHRS